MRAGVFRRLGRHQLLRQLPQDQSTVVRSYRPKCTDFPGTLRAPQIMTVALVAMNAESDRPYLIATVAFQIGRPRFACPNKGTGIPGNGVPVPTC